MFSVLIHRLDRMFTSKLFVDPAHVAEAEKDDWAKYNTFISARIMVVDMTAARLPRSKIISS